MMVAYAADGFENVATGVHGGASAEKVPQRLQRVDGHEDPMPAVWQDLICDGEILYGIAPGGGGYGPADRRNPDAVAKDVSEKWISAERARDIYKGFAVAGVGTRDNRRRHRDTGGTLCDANAVGHFCYCELHRNTKPVSQNGGCD